MGNKIFQSHKTDKSPYHAQSPVTPRSTIIHRRKSSRHSGQFYSPSVCHLQTPSSELRDSLPSPLQPYTDSIETIYRFWMNHIDSMNESDLNETSVLFFVNVLQSIPDSAQLFQKGIELHSKQFFGMFRWLITNLANPDPQKLIKSIKSLGQAHKNMNIKDEWFEIFLKCFHQTIEEQVGSVYTARCRFCMEQLYTVVMNLMINRDFQTNISSCSNNISSLLKSMKTLQHCLDDTIGRKYLEIYMEQHFCSELILFYNDYRKYKVSINNYQRKSIGSLIMKKYLNERAECEINVSYGSRMTVFNTIKKQKGAFSPDLFDNCAKECIALVQLNIWTQFRNTIKDAVAH